MIIVPNRKLTDSSPRDLTGIPSLYYFTRFMCCKIHIFTFESHGRRFTEEDKAPVHFQFNTLSFVSHCSFYFLFLSLFASLFFYTYVFLGFLNLSPYFHHIIVPFFFIPFYTYLYTICLQPEINFHYLFSLLLCFPS
jgi:hypothetical protein